ncbi:MAG: methylenetetrahydrofolate reductase [NAD(P)H] [Gammaproteobacteria bacterium]
MPANEISSLSFEVFPPCSDIGVANLENTCQQLSQFNPNFFSVTFGAGGSSQLKTKKVVHDLVANDIPVVPHISCINTSREDILLLLDEYIKKNIKRLVVIRGDAAKEANSTIQYFNYANELVEFIREKSGNYFHITVAAYPEFHPQAVSVSDDLENFRCKVNAGANSAITQFFFNVEAYFRFLECCDKLDIHIPIIPGIIPINNYQKLLQFSKTCGAEIPLWLRKRMDSLIHDVKSLHNFGVDIVSALCEKLIAGGAPGLHFYTLNQSEPTRLIVENLGLIPAATLCN